MRSAARPGAHDARTSSAGLVACFIERENKGLSRLESFFLGTIFQNSTNSFPFGVLGWPRRRERAIKLMNGRLMDFIPPLRRKTREMHVTFFFLCVSRVWESYLWQMETLASTFPCTSDHSSSFSSRGCSSAFYLLSQLDKCRGQEDREIICMLKCWHPSLHTYTNAGWNASRQGCWNSNLKPYNKCIVVIPLSHTVYIRVYLK